MRFIPPVVRLIMATVFLVSGVAKITDRKTLESALRDFGIPASLALASGLLLSSIEILIAAALVLPQFAWYGACGALTLLAAIFIGISITLLRGLKPDCHCFGRLFSVPAGGSTLIRIGVLAAGAGWLVLRGRLLPVPSGAHNEVGLIGLAAGGLILWFLLRHAAARSTRS
jgi:hypothetical protein